MRSSCKKRAHHKLTYTYSLNNAILTRKIAEGFAIRKMKSGTAQGDKNGTLRAVQRKARFRRAAFVAANFASSKQSCDCLKVRFVAAPLRAIQFCTRVVVDLVYLIECVRLSRRPRAKRAGGGTAQPFRQL